MEHSITKSQQEKINKLLNEYDIVYLVGNQYCKNKPSKSDINIKFIPEKDNIYDPNAIQVVSIKNGKKYKLGYIGKSYTSKIKKHIDSIKIYKILKIDNGTLYPYYHILYKIIQ